jgi:helicase MOV-10
LYSKLFYDDELVACADPKLVNSLLQWPHLPNHNIPMMFAHAEGVENRDNDSPSWYNELEISMVERFVKLLNPFVYSKGIYNLFRSFFVEID